MKTCALFTLLCFASCIDSNAKIINGYEKDIATARSSLKHLLLLPQDKNVRQRIESIEEFILHHELTNRLLHHFKIITPTLYHDIDTLRDFKNRPVDIYVQFVPASEVHPGTKATTNLDQIENDPHGYRSVHGHFTVSVRITITKHSLLILAHELGHVSYQVPNLARYIGFFSRQYRDHNMRATYLGHKANDPSGQQAQLFEKMYRRDYAKYLALNKATLNPFEIRDQIIASMKQKLN